MDNQRIGISRKVTVGAVVIIIVVASLSIYTVMNGGPPPSCSSASSAPSTTASVHISINETSAAGFFARLASPLGLETEHNGSHVIWLADDQALDYYALLSIFSSTDDSNALSLAQQVGNSIPQWGGFYNYCNPVFEVIGHFPNSTQVMRGTDETIKTSEGYTINATVFEWSPGFEYSLFADQLAYRVLLDLHVGDQSGAESEFTKLSGMWNGYGFNDSVFQKDDTHTYQSYKLADYVIAWKALDDVPGTQQFALGYQSTVQSIASMMSGLQSTAGGVWTGYTARNGQISYGNGISSTNGETTSLFIIAATG
jgi:hypothetical protein